jgi:diguanylate cyclase (GGDEF)-like protein
MSTESSTAVAWLIRTIQKISEALTVEQALHDMVEHLKEFIPHDSLAVIMVDENTDNLVIKTSRQISYSFVKKFHRPINGVVIPKVLLKHETVILNDLRPEMPEYAEIKLESDLQSVVLAPIIQSQRTIGYLHCERKEGEFTPTEGAWLQALGLVVGNVIEKYNLMVLTRHLSRVDEASKALKYHAFLDEYRMELARSKSYKQCLSLIFLDVDDYTGFVQTCGIEAGHLLLEKIHYLIRESVREIDLIGRFAADEFIVCMGGADRDMAAAALKKINTLVREKAAPGSGCAVTVSGVAMTMQTPEELNLPLAKILAALGSGLITVRAHGRDQVMSIDPPTQ